jgi:Ni/Co efflux regulator RcnB
MITLFLKKGGNMKRKGKISKIPSNEPVKYYVTEEATLRCAFGSETVKLKTPGRKTARINDKLQANIMDFKPMMNIPSFGLCRCRKNPAVAAATAANHGRLTPVPCVPNTTIPWINGKDDVIMDRAPALLNTSTNMCLWGGKLGFVQFEHDNSGQRIEQGITSMLNGAMMIFIGMASIEASLAAMLICPLPSVVLGASGIIGAGATTTAMGMSDVAEGEQEVWYGATGSTRESVNPVLKHVFKGNRGAYNSAEIIATLVASCGLIAIQPYAKSLGMKKAAQGATSAKPKPVNTSALRLQGEKVNAVEETKLAGNAATAPRKLTAAEKYKYRRPTKFRKGVRDKSWDYSKESDGNVRDTLTKKVMDKNEPWDMGHREGYEFRKHQLSAAEREISRKQFLDEHNDYRHYRPELPSSNRSHLAEDPSDLYFGP